MIKRLPGIISSTLALTFVVSFSSCGIDTLSYLEFEPVSKSSTISALTFTGPSGGSDYSGVYVFYKIYAYDAPAITDRNTVISKQNADNVVPGSIITSYLIPSSGLGYKACILNGQEFIPTLKKSVIGTNEINIDFSGFAAGAEPVLTIDGGSAYIIARNVTGTSGYKSYQEYEPKSSDADFKSYSSDVDDEYYVQFFAASYGYDSSLNDVYSDAVYLGLITLNYN